MKRIIYPGSFDPVTCGHLDIILRAASMTDELVVAILQNPKKNNYFTLEERMEMLKSCVAGLGNVRVDCSDKLLVDYIRSMDAKVIIRGLRAVSDFEYELQMAMMNRKLAGDIETVFLMTDSEYSFLSSSMVRQIGSLGGDISAMVPGVIHGYVKKRLMNK